jgi:hypothetical protein
MKNKSRTFGRRWPMPARYQPLPPKDTLVRPVNTGLKLHAFGKRVWPTVTIRALAHAKMRALTQVCPIEIGWMAEVEKTSDYEYALIDVHVAAQVCTIGTTRMTEDGMGDMMGELMMSGNRAALSRLKCWGHSHGSLGVFASGVDEDQTNDFIEQHDDYFIRIITNHRDECHLSVYDIAEGIGYEHAAFTVEQASDQMNTEMFAWAQTEYETKVTKKQEEYTSFYGADDGLYVLPSEQVLETWLKSGYVSPEFVSFTQGKRAQVTITPLVYQGKTTP